MYKLIVLLFVVLFCNCAIKWYNPEKNQQEFADDEYKCQCMSYQAQMAGGNIAGYYAYIHCMENYGWRR